MCQFMIVELNKKHTHIIEDNIINMQQYCIIISGIHSTFSGPACTVVLCIVISKI